jgi:ankyrin repeat protein
MARTLIARGANVTSSTSSEMTPLHWAANMISADAAMIELLLKSGAIDWPCEQGRLTPLELARNVRPHNLIPPSKKPQVVEVSGFSRPARGPPRGGHYVCTSAILSTLI